MNKIRIISLLLAFILSWGSAQAQQKTALVDMEFIMSKLPAYINMTQQLTELSKKYQAEVSRLEGEAQTLYKRYQADLKALSPEQKVQREEAIVAKEKQAYELKRKYFAPEGELSKRREEWMKPVQDEIWKSLKELATQGGYILILDRSTGKIVYADPDVDISKQVLERMGYSK